MLDLGERIEHEDAAGAVLWGWDADPDFHEIAGEQWLFLLPSKWNPSHQGQVYSWRFDPREFGVERAPQQRPDGSRRDTE